MHNIIKFQVSVRGLEVIEWNENDALEPSLASQNDNTGIFRSLQARNENALRLG